MYAIKSQIQRLVVDETTQSSETFQFLSKNIKVLTGKKLTLKKKRKRKKALYIDD